MEFDIIRIQLDVISMEIDANNIQIDVISVEVDAFNMKVDVIGVEPINVQLSSWGMLLKPCATT